MTAWCWRRQDVFRVFAVCSCLRDNSSWRVPRCWFDSGQTLQEASAADRNCLHNISRASLYWWIVEVRFVMKLSRYKISQLQLQNTELSFWYSQRCTWNKRGNFPFILSPVSTCQKENADVSFASFRLIASSITFHSDSLTHELW